MSGEFIDTAGTAPAAGPSGLDLRKSAIAEVRRILRAPTSTDSEVEEALESLVELSKG